MSVDLDRIRRIAARMKHTANRFPGGATMAAAMSGQQDRYRRLDSETGASLIFTFDTGPHTSGWWKNPDYERCYHLSLASMGALFEAQPMKYFHAQAAKIPELTRATREAWAQAFFGDFTRLIWIEPPVSKVGKLLETWHYRLFVDEGGTPLLPRGEVYSRELTEAGWKSWSDIHGDEATP